MRKGRRQIGRHDARDQECQSDEAEAVEDQKRPQRFGPSQEAEFWPDVSLRDDPPRDEAECDAHEKTQLRQHESLLRLVPTGTKGSRQCGTGRYRLSRETMMTTASPR